jgi:hypothetical protein
LDSILHKGLVKLRGPLLPHLLHRLLTLGTELQPAGPFVERRENAVGGLFEHPARKLNDTHPDRPPE